MAQTTPRSLEYAPRGARRPVLDYVGIASFFASLLLSPVVVLGLLANDDLRRVTGPIPTEIALPLIAVLMTLSALLPLIAYLSNVGRTGRKWAAAGFLLSLLGWGAVIAFAMVFVPPWAGMG